MPEYYVHPTSIIDQGADIAPGVKIWHFCHISAPSQIGPDSSLGQNVFVARNVRIGRNVKIQNNVSVYEGVILEDDVFCGPSMVFTNVINPRSFVSRKDEYRTTLVKRGASIGANATVVCGVTIGRYAFVGAGAVVTRDVPDYALVYGNPSRQHGWMCKCGDKLDLSPPLTACPRCGSSYRLDGASLLPVEER